MDIEGMNESAVAALFEKHAAWINDIARAVDPRDIGHLVLVVGRNGNETMTLRGRVLGEFKYRAIRDGVRIVTTRVDPTPTPRADGEETTP